MNEWLKNLWNKNRIFFLILLPLVLIILFKDIILAVLIGMARKNSDKTKKEDEELKNDLHELEINSKILEEKAKDLDKQIEERNNSEISEDWHKKQ